MNDTMRVHDGFRRLLDGGPVRLLGVWAHPDDEAYLSAGLMHRVAQAGGRVAVVSATRGERGVPDDDPRPPSTIARLREAELRASLTEVGAHSLRFLDHGDGELESVPFELGVIEVVRVLEANRPDVVVTFGPDGITGHPDHLAIHRWVTEACRRRGHESLLYAVMAEQFLHRYRDLHEEINLFEWHPPVGIPEDDVALAVELDDRELDRKRRALGAHASQTTGLAATLGEATYRTWWQRETFRCPTRAELDVSESAAA